MTNKSAKKEKGIRHFLKRPVSWLYLCIFYMITGYGFYRTVLFEGSSNLSGTANYSIIAMILLIPLLAIGNNERSNEKKRTADTGDTYISNFIHDTIVFFIGIAVYIPLGVVVSIYGVFRWGLFLNTLINISMMGLSLLAFSVFVSGILKKRKWMIICLYGIVALIIGIEISLNMDYPQNIYSILYNISLSKYTFGLNVGILDWKSIVMFCCITGLFTILMFMTSKNNSKQSSSQLPVKGSMTKKLQTTSAVILSIAILSILVTQNGSSYGLDMTPVGFFTPGTYAKEYIETLDQKVTITVLDSKESFIDKKDYSSYFLHAERVIEGFAKSSENIILEYKEIQEDKTFLELYDLENPSAGDILVTSDSDYHLIPSEELFNFTYPYDQEGNLYMQIASSKTEQEICSAIDKVTSEESEQVTFLLGNNEDENYIELASFLEKNGHKVLFTDINEEEIPDAKLAVIFAPAEDYTDTGMLEEFLYNEGRYSRNLLYVANSDTSLSTDNLDAFLSKWGITIENYTIMETEEENYVNNDQLYGLNEYIEASFISDYEYLSKPAIVPYSRNITIDDSSTSLYYRILLQSKDTSCLINQNTLIDELDNYNTAVISSYYQTTAFGNTYTGISGHVAAIGSQYAFAADIFENSEYSNSEYFEDVLNELLGKNEVRIPIAEKSMALGPVEMPSSARNILAVTCIFVPPLSILAAGTLFYISRYKRRLKYAD